MQNPVLIKEVKTKMRSRHSRRVQFTAAGLIGLFVLYCYYEALTYLVRFGGSNAGTDGWYAGVVLQAIIIWILAPALTANAISQEKEQQTWEMLVFTLLTPREIIEGKLMARLIPMVGVLAAFFPFMFFCYLWSTSLTLLDFAATYLIFGIWVLFLTVSGLFMSWAFRKTAAAIAMSYMVVFGLTIVTALLHYTLTLSHPVDETVIIWLNPVRIADALLNLKKESVAGGVLMVSSAFFVATAGLFLWRMMACFRTFAVE